MPKEIKANSWDEYMQAHLKDIPKGKESEYIAAVMVGYQNKNQDPPAAYSKKKAEKDTAALMKNPLFKEQMQNNQAEMLAMMSQGQYAEMVKMTASPIASVKENIETAYKELENVQKKMTDGTYGITPNKEWTALQEQVNESIANNRKEPEKDEKPEITEARKITDLLKVYVKFKDYEATVPRNSPDHAKLNSFGLDILTALGGGQEVVSRRIGEHFAQADREVEEMEKEVSEELRKKEPENAAPGPMM